MSDRIDTDAATDGGLAVPDVLHAHAGEDGWLRSLGADHAALFRPGGDGTLIVEFDELGSIGRRSDGLPWSAAIARKRKWSALTVMARGRTWYRDPEVFAFFDGLTDDGFFDDFDTVIFVGAGVGGYAAGAFSVAAPGATVVLISPFATLDRDITPWERRFRGDRALSFGPRYGFAPEMIEAAERVYVVSDPTEAADAMHASLFQGAHVTHLPARHGGPMLADRLDSTGVLFRLVGAAASGRLDRVRFAQLWRRRRGDEVWLSNLLRKIDAMDRPWLMAVFAGFMLDATGAPAARRRLNDALAQLAEEGRDAPDGRQPAPVPRDRQKLMLAGE